MAISDVEFLAEYTGNGITDTFTFPYPVIEVDDVIVYTVDDDEKTLYVRGTHYNSTGDPNRNIYNYVDVVFEVDYIPAEGVKIYLVRQTDALQLAVFLANAQLNPAAMEAALDRMILLIQEERGRVNRAILTDEHGETEGITLESPVDGAGIYYDESENRYKNTSFNLELLTTTITTAAESVEIDASSAASSAAAALASANAASLSEISAAEDAAAAEGSAIAAHNEAVNAAESAIEAENYVALGLAGFDFISPCTVASTEALTATYDNGTSGVGATLTNAGVQATLVLDGVYPDVSDRVLIKDQSDEEENGVYIVTSVGSGATNWVLTRATDFDQAEEVKTGILTTVKEGYISAGLVYCVISDSSPIIGTDEIVFDKINLTGVGAGTVIEVVAGDGLSGGTITESGTIALDIASLDAATPTTSDLFTFADATDSDTPKKAALSTLSSIVSSFFPIGMTYPYIGTTAPTGYVLLDGRTIGNASSNATQRANTDTETLYAWIWDNVANAQCPIYTSAGSPSTRGVNAAADFAANKALAVPDFRGRTPVGLDNMGGSAASRVTSASTSGTNAIVLGGAFGAETHTLSLSQMPAHTHAGTSGKVTTGLSGASRSVPMGSTTGEAGGGLAHSNTQPSIAIAWIMRL